MSLSIKTNDIVIIISGNERGKKGKVLEVDRSKNRVLVQGINIVKKHQKPTRQIQKGGIIDMEKPIHRSKVMLICQKCNKPTRIATKFLADGKKVRYCKKCMEVMDS
jgi:large subunit ribosomal protein L24